MSDRRPVCDPLQLVRAFSNRQDNTMSPRVEIVVVYLAGLLQGLSLITFPAAANILTNPEFHGLSSSRYGSLFIPMVVCAIVASSAGGPLASRFTLKRVFLLGLAFNLIAMSTLALSASFTDDRALAYAMLLGAMAALGVGFGLTLTALNTYVARFFPERAETALTALHALLGTGTALAPVLIAVVSGAGVWWLLPLSVAIALAALGGVAARQPLEPSRETSSAARGGALDFVHHLSGDLWLFAAAVILYGVAETIFANWAVLYLHEDAGLSQEWASYGLAAFWAMVTVGRTLIAAVSIWFPGRWIYLALPLLILAAFLVVPRAESPIAGVVVFGFAGLACSGFLPLSISFSGARYPRIAEVVSGGMMAAYMVGYGIGSFGVGPLREAAELELSTIYTLASALGVAMLAVVIVLARRGALAGERTGS